MMNGERKPLNFEDLDEFLPRSKSSSSNKDQVKAIDAHSAFPSREREDESQINIKASRTALDRFRYLARKERYRHGEFMEVLMDVYIKASEKS